jgi:hypothetical protein
MTRGRLISLIIILVYLISAISYLVAAFEIIPVLLVAEVAGYLLGCFVFIWFGDDFIPVGTLQNRLLPVSEESPVGLLPLIGWLLLFFPLFGLLFKFCV